MCFTTDIADRYLSVQEELIKAGYFPYPPIDLLYNGIQEKA